MVETREDFCGLCMAVPLALVGAGVTGLTSAKDYQTRKWVKLSVYMVILVIALILFINYKDCEKCNVK